MRRLTVMGAILAALALPAVALGESGWEAQYVSQTPNLTLESGETATSSFTARNIGTTTTWDASFTNLGTTNPRDRASIMFNPGDWIATYRATPSTSPRSPRARTGRSRSSCARLR